MPESKTSFVPSPVNVKRVRRIRTWISAITFLSVLIMMVSDILIVPSMDEATRSFLSDLSFFAAIPTLISGFGLLISIQGFDITPLKGADLLEMTKMVEENSELEPFVRDIKAQGRDPVIEDKKTASLYVRRSKKQAKEEEARQAWDSLQTQ